MKTTLNIRLDILALIDKAAHASGISRTELILELIQKIASDIAEPGQIGKMIKYQARRNPEDWHKFHVTIREDMYEYWLDMRKLMKMSVSAILAYAVKKCLGKKVKIGDNYRFINYVIIKEIVENVIIWKFVWGWPPSLSKLVAN